MSEIDNSGNQTLNVTEETASSISSLKDFETDVFDAVYDYIVPDKLPDGNFRSEYVSEFESLPLGTLIRMDSIPDWNRQSTSDYEDLTVDTYESHVYALTMDECKNIANALAERMRQMNFRRLTMRPVLNGNDTSVSQIVMRFEHRIDNKGNMYR